MEGRKKLWRDKSLKKRSEEVNRKGSEDKR